MRPPSVQSPEAAPARTGADRDKRRQPRDPLAGRLGVSVPHEWWPSTPLLKSYEAAGFSWVQLHSPPISVLTDARSCRRHAGALGAALSQTSLRAVLHAPARLRIGHSPHKAFDGLLSYAAEVGAEQVVYHALAFPEEPANADAAETEARGLALLVRVAERLGLRIAIENLAPVYPGPESISASPLTVRSLVRRINSPALRLCLDVGHAHVIADAHHTWVETICEPVLDTVGLFHIHDNLGARRARTGKELGVDPLRLDLHLPPGRGTVPWERLAPLLSGHTAPLVVEVHPPFRPRAAELCRRTHELLRRGRLS